MTRIWLALLVGFWLASVSDILAIRLEDLEPNRRWHLRELVITGNDRLTRSDLTGMLLTETRPWYRFWADYPAFDPVTFRADLERLRRFYESRGFYRAEVDYDLTVEGDDDLVNGRIIVREGAPVIVAEVDVSVSQNPTSPERLPIATGDVFSEEAYLRSEALLKQFYSEQGYAYVESERKAEIVLDSNQAFLSYHIDPGPPSTFGATAVLGIQDIESEIIRRELAYKPGDPYSPKKIAESRERLLALDLFGVVDISADNTAGKSAVVPMQVQVTEKEAREIRLGVGYGTEDRVRAQLEWRNNNWLGDGRRLSIVTKYSVLESSGGLTFIQPHLFSPDARGVVNVRHEKTDEETYSLQATRFNPRLEYRFSDHLSGFVGYRLEHDHFSQVGRATIDALGGVEKKGLVSGPSLGLAWNTTDNLLDPSRGEILNFTADQAGAPWGGRYRFYRLVAEGKKFWSIGWETIFATRLKLGFANAFGAEENLPLSERLYAGGEKSVRGYGRRKLGPRSAANDPIGGLSLLEGSLELRRPIWQALGGALFVDFGQVSRRAFDVPVGSVKFAAGFGLSYATPVGPVRVDFGFPFSPPRGDQSYQVYFSIGAAF